MAGDVMMVDDKRSIGIVTGSDLPLHLLRLVSPSLPVGAFSYSRGLEAATHAGWVVDESTAGAWILGMLEHGVAPFDGALFWRMMQALEAGDEFSFAEADMRLAAGRESREMELEDRRMAEALLKLLDDLGVRSVLAHCPASYPGAFALAAHHWRIGPMTALKGLFWSIVEAQVAAAIRLVPLGQTSGQRILIATVPAVERCAASASILPDRDIGNVCVAMAMGCAWHETQYSRLFRS